MHAFGHRICPQLPSAKFSYHGLRQALKQIRHRCFFCRRFQGRGRSVFMSDLPATRFQDPNENLYPFKTVGISYCRKLINGEAIYLLVHVLYYSCYAFRNDRKPHNGQLRDSYSQVDSTPRLTTTKTLGQCDILHRSEKQLQTEPLSFDTEIASYLHDQNISWKMKPPSAPHFVGVWERLVQMIKRVFLLICTPLYLFITIVAETEGLLNERPLTHVNHDIADDLPLTPNHFLLGRPFVYTPSAAFSDQPTSRLSAKCWRLVKEKMDFFWRRLLKEYAPTLIRRTKWSQPEDIIKSGDLVWILEDFSMDLVTWTNHRDFHRA